MRLLTLTLTLATSILSISHAQAAPDVHDVHRIFSAPCDALTRPAPTNIGKVILEETGMYETLGFVLDDIIPVGGLNTEDTTPRTLREHACLALIVLQSTLERLTQHCLANVDS